VKVEPEQEALPQETEVAACWQAPAPSQAPVLPQVPPLGQRTCGSAPFSTTLAQTPALPVTLQAWQVAQLAALQQTPSVQWPVPHSWSLPQLVPGPLSATQLPFVPVQ
jgi:hypothetical protein